VWRFFVEHFVQYKQLRADMILQECLQEASKNAAAGLQS
jgi:hypothetical protein